MSLHRVRKSGDLSRLSDYSKDYYSLNFKLTGVDRENYEKALHLITERLGVAPSNPMAFSLILREFAKNVSI